MSADNKRPYPRLVCLACGLRLGFRSAGKGAVWSSGACGVCGQKCNVTSPANFGHLRGSYNYAGPLDNQNKNLPAIIESKKGTVVETTAVTVTTNTRSAIKKGDYVAADEAGGRVA